MTDAEQFRKDGFARLPPPDISALKPLRLKLERYQDEQRSRRKWGMDDRSFLTIPQDILDPYMDVLIPLKTRDLLHKFAEAPVAYDGCSLIAAPSNCKPQRVHKDQDFRPYVGMNVVVSLNKDLKTFVRPGSHTREWEPAFKSRDGMEQADCLAFAYDTRIEHAGAGSKEAVEGRLFFQFYANYNDMDELNELRAAVAMDERIDMDPYFIH
jgi:hypothetical protein